MFKKIIGLSTAVITMMVSIFAPVGVRAQNVDTSNSDTGSNSTNTNTLNITNTLTITIINDSSSTNNINLDLNTGGNNVENNTEVGDVETGTAEFDIAVENQQNEIDDGNLVATLFDDFFDDNLSIEASNSNTGADSTNENNQNISNTASVDITRTATAENNIDVVVNTGNNTIANNTKVGDIKTGDIIGNIEILNALNSPFKPSAAAGPAGGGVTPSPTTLALVSPPELAAVLTPSPTITQAPTSPAQPPTAAPAEIKPAGNGEFFPAGSSNSFGLYIVLTLITYAISQDRIVRRKLNSATDVMSNLILGRTPQGLTHTPLRGGYSLVCGDINLFSNKLNII